jgi:hypothetical protein
LSGHSTGCVLDKQEETQMDGVVGKKKNEYTNENLLKDIRLSEPSDFQNFLRLDTTSFDELLKMITPRIEKKEYYHVICYSYKSASTLF